MGFRGNTYIPIVLCVACVLACTGMYLGQDESKPDDGKVSIGNDPQITDMLEDLASDVRVISHSIQTDSLKSRLPQNSIYPIKAEEAYKEAIRLIESRDDNAFRSKARVYLLNAINHCPREKEYIKAYAELVWADDAKDYQQLSDLDALLSASIFQVDPGQIPEVQEMISHNQDKMRNAIQQASNKEPQENHSVSSEEETVLNLPMESLDVDVSILRERLQTLHGFLEQSQIEDKNAITTRIEETNMVLSAILICDQLDHCLENMSLVTPESDAAVTMIQAAETMAFPLWGLPLEKMPEKLKTRCLEYPSRMQSEASRIAKAKDKPILSHIREIKNKADGPQKSINDRINSLEKGALEINQLMRELKSDTSQKEAMNYIQEIGQALQDCQKKQLNEYNLWAVIQLEQLYEQARMSEEGWFTTFDNEDAERLFKESTVPKIAKRYLTPEVLELYSDVVNKFMTEGPAELTHELFLQQVKTDKKTPESF